jgi:hypothetical protein
LYQQIYGIRIAADCWGVAFQVSIPDFEFLAVVLPPIKPGKFFVCFNSVRLVISILFLATLTWLRVSLFCRYKSLRFNQRFRDGGLKV